MTRATGTGRRWLVRREERPEAALDLYCFAHAGGTPGEYARWSDDLPDVQVNAVQLPGRGARLTEPAHTRMTDLTRGVLAEFDPDRQFAFFGHSLGGLVAFEVARALRDGGRPMPERLFLSSAPPPDAGRHGTALHQLPDGELLAEIERRWGALPDVVHRDPRMLEIALRAFRADFEIFETYRYTPGEPLDVPVTAIVGADERDGSGVRGWAGHTRAGVDLHTLPGGHFYFRAREQRQALLRLVAARLGRTTDGRNA